MNTMRYPLLAVDPGKEGGLVSYSRGIVTATHMPGNRIGTWNWFQHWNGLGAVAYLEKVGGYIGEGRGDRGSHMFQFGRFYGWMELALTVIDAKIVATTPQEWQGEFQMSRAEGETDSSWKNRLKVLAQALYPEVRVTLATADSLLLLEYGRRRQSRGA